MGLSCVVTLWKLTNIKGREGLLRLLMLFWLCVYVCVVPTSACLDTQDCEVPAAPAVEISIVQPW